MAQHTNPERIFLFMKGRTYIPIPTEVDPITKKKILFYENEKWCSIPKMPKIYEVSNWGRVRKNIGLKIVYLEFYVKDNHVWVSIDSYKHTKVEFRMVDLVLSTFDSNYEVGARVKFKDGNFRNVSVSNIRYKKQPVYFNADIDTAKDWKCGRKAASANSRFSNSTLEKVSACDVYRVLEIMQFKCFYCGDNLDKNTWHLDHYIPVSKGGDNTFKNLACSCSRCNIMKHDLDGNQFFKMIKKLSSTKIFKNKGDFA